MEQIIINITDSDKAKWLLGLLEALDFVNLVEMKNDDGKEDSDQEEHDFFAFAGLWKDRKISVDSIRKNAWSRQSL